MNAALLIAGTWLFSDAIYSYVLYSHQTQSWRGDKQTWMKDHWIRAIRGIIGIFVVVAGIMEI